MQQISQVSQIFPCQPRTGAPGAKSPMREETNRPPSSVQQGRTRTHCAATAPFKAKRPEWLSCHSGLLRLADAASNIRRPAQSQTARRKTHGRRQLHSLSGLFQFTAHLQRCNSRRISSYSSRRTLVLMSCLACSSTSGK